MKKQNIEVEGGELLIQSKEGHYAIIPAKHRQEVIDMVKNGCNDCVNAYIQTLPKDSDYAEDGSLYPEEPVINPNNPVPLEEATITAEAPTYVKYKQEWEKENPFDINEYVEDRFNNPVGREAIARIDEKGWRKQLQQEGLQKRQQELDEVTKMGLLYQRFNPQGKDDISIADEQFQKRYGTSPHRYRYDNDPEYRNYYGQLAKESTSKIDYPSTDLRRKDAVPTNSLWMYPNLTGESRAQATNFSNEVIGSALPIPGLEAMGKIPSVFKAGKNLIKPASKAVGKTDDVVKSEILNKLSETKTHFSKALAGTTNTLDQIKGELLQGKSNRESIKKGNEWLERWILHPATIEKINADMDFAARVFGDPALQNLIKAQSKNYKPNSKEYPLFKQLYDNLQQYVSKNSEASIHHGNWGVSYNHYITPQQRRDLEKGLIHAPDKHGSWISRTTRMSQDKRISTTIHEGTHDWISDGAIVQSGMRDVAFENMNPLIKNDFLEWESLHIAGMDPVEKMGKKRAYQAYLADPTELHARIMELRYALEITPDYKMDSEVAEMIIKLVEKGGTDVDPMFLNVIDKDPKKLANLFNKFWGVTPAATIGTGAAIQSQNNKNKPEEL